MWRSLGLQAGQTNGGRRCVVHASRSFRRTLERRESSVADVFISYSRKNVAFARLLHQALEDREFTTWIDWQDIPPSTEWLAEVYTAIQESDTFVFVISQASVGSEICKLEIAHAAQHNKRLIPVVIDEVDPQKVSPELAALNWLFFLRQDEFGRAFQDLIDAIQTDYAWVKEHTRLQVRALEWQRKEREAGYLLRGRDLAEAEAWLAQAPGRKTQPTGLHTEYILASRRGEVLRLRQTIAGVMVSVLLIIGALLVAVVVQSDARKQAEAALKVATSRQLAAVSAQHLDRDLSLSLLLSLEALDTLDTVEARSSLIDGLNRSACILALLHGQEASVTSIAYSPDGKLVATGSCHEEEYLGSGISVCTRGAIYLWDAETYQLLEILHSSLQNALALAFTPNGDALAVGGSNARGAPPARRSIQGAIELWDLAARRRVGTSLVGQVYDHPQLDNQVEHLAFSPDGRWLAASGNAGGFDQLDSAGTVTVWDVSRRQVASVLPFSWWITGLAFAPEGDWLAASSAGGETVGLWPFGPDGPSQEVLEWETATPRGIAFHPDGSLLAVSHQDGSISFHTPLTGESLGTALAAGADSGVTLSFSADGRYLASSGQNRRLTVWELGAPYGDLRPRVAFELPVEDSRMAFAHVGYRLASAGADRTTLWDLERRHPLIETEFASDGPSLGVAFSPDGSLLAAISRSGISLWSVQEGVVVLAVPGQPSGWVQTSVAFSPDGRTLIIGDEMFDHNVTLWDIEMNQPIAAGLEGHKAGVWSVAYSPRGDLAASGSEDGTIIFWDPLTGTPMSGPLTDRIGYDDLIWKGGAAENGIMSIAFTPDGETLVSGRYDGTILLWDISAQHPLGDAWVAHRSAVEAVAVSPDGKMLVSGGEDGLVRLWDLEARVLIAELVGHTGSVSGLTLSSDGALLASSEGFGGPLRLWDLTTRHPLGRVKPELSDHVYGVAFAPQGGMLATGGERLALWDLALGTWREQAQRIANRDLTEAERALYLDPAP